MKTVKSSTNWIAVFFVGISIHVLLIYYLKNIFGFHINDIEYIAIKMWKELLLVMILIYHFLIRLKNFDFSFDFRSTDILIIIFFCFGFFYLIIAPNFLTGIWSFRSLYEIFIFYWVGRLFTLNILDYRRLFSVLVCVGVFASIFAVIQVEVFGPDFFKEVYGIEDIARAHRSYGYEKIRATSTFITAHEFGLYLVIQFVFLSFLWIFKDKHGPSLQVLFIVIFFLIIGLVYALSRSSIVILLICGSFFAIRKPINFLVFLGLTILIYLGLEFTGAVANIMSIISGENPSTTGRIDVLLEAWNFIKENPFGAGLGTVGVVVRRFIPTSPQFEGEFFNIIAQMSIVGGGVYLGILFSVFKKAYSQFNNSLSHADNKLAMCIMLIVIALFLRELILPRDFSNYSIGWFLFGTYISYLNTKNHDFNKLKFTLVPMSDAD